MTIPVFITARLGSTRMPRKHLLPLGDIPVIENIVRRCEHFGFEPHLCVPEDDVGEFAGHTSCLDVFGGDEENIEQRLIECATHFNIRHFHALDGDDPYFSPEMVAESFRWGSGMSRVYPCIESESGEGLVGTTYNLDGNKQKSAPLAIERTQRVWPQRLTLDYPEDYHLICAVNRMVGGYMAPRWAVDELFIRNPDLHKVNWFRTEEWKDRQRRESSR